MTKPRIVIYGLGQLGFSFAELLTTGRFADLFDLVAIVVHRQTPEQVAWQLNHNTVYGQAEFTTKAGERSTVICKDHTILVCQSANPEDIPWEHLNADIVLDCTGKHTSRKELTRLIEAGAPMVLLTAPGKGDIPTFVYGVNHRDYTPGTKIFSAASCTTTALAPLVKVLLSMGNIESLFMKTIHSVTASQNLVDGTNTKDWRSGRSAIGNIIPATTGAAAALSLVLPELADKTCGMAYRVPVLVGSIADVTVTFANREVSREEVCEAMRRASVSNLEGVLEYTEFPMVSSDVIHDPRASVFDPATCMVIGERSKQVTLSAWYDNVFGYCNAALKLAYYALRVEQDQR